MPVLEFCTFRAHLVTLGNSCLPTLLTPAMEQHTHDTCSCCNPPPTCTCTPRVNGKWPAVLNALSDCTD